MDEFVFILENARNIQPLAFYQKNLPNFNYDASLSKEWVDGGLCPFHNDRNRGSFRINLHNGAFKCFACNTRGCDIIAFVRKLYNISYQKALFMLNEKFILQKPPKVTKPSKPPTNTCLPPPKVPFFLQIWQKSHSAIGSVVEKYLKNRGYDGEIPESIRFHPRIFHYETNKYYPAMVAAVTNVTTGKLIAIHRTYFDNAQKALITPNKKMLGNVKGGAVAFGAISDIIIISEGIETALSIYLATNYYTLATLSASNMMSIILPPTHLVNKVIIAADNDEAGIKACYAAADRLSNFGYKISICYPDSVNDFNDLLQAGGRV